ncbi:hypothetical protein B0H11DRAFT_1943704 [Mycena galericulata]|nr:hypothetical protein B0H11DRAFT_1943704 [Mycena galericulata]
MSNASVAAAWTYPSISITCSPTLQIPSAEQITLGTTYPTSAVNASTHLALVAPRYDVIRPLQAPSLEHLTFRAVQHGSMETMHDLFTTPPVIFNNNTPRLLHLRLVSATISWTSANIYSSLTVLEIINVARVRWPSEPEMVGMLASARSLVALVIKNCGVRHLRYGAQSRSFYIPQLVTLDLHKSNGMTSVIRALRHALTPALRCVTLRGFDGAHLRLLQTNLQGFVKNPTTSNQTQQTPEIFLLDIDCDAGQFVAVLADNPQYGTKLTSLAVADVNLALIHAYVMCRSNEKTQYYDYISTLQTNTVYPFCNHITLVRHWDTHRPLPTHIHDTAAGIKNYTPTTYPVTA